MLLLELAGGLVLLVAGGDALVRGAVTLATRLGVSPLLIGLTLVGFGTSTPELVTSLEAALSGAPAIAVGNVVGSNIANILLILGIAALIQPVAAAPGAFRRDGTALVLATLAGVAVALAGEIGRPAGLALVAGLAVYLVVTWRGERRGGAAAGVHLAEAAAAPAGPGNPWLAAAMAVGGIALTILGAKLLVSGAVTLAEIAGVSQAVIGLTIVAVGTSLPELVTSVMAAMRRQADVAFGNIVGSNIFNILGILGVTALVHPVAVPAEIAGFDIWAMLAVTLVFVVFAITGNRISRGEGATFLGAYVAYTLWLAAGAS